MRFLFILLCLSGLAINQSLAMEQANNNEPTVFLAKGSFNWHITPFLQILQSENVNAADSENSPTNIEQQLKNILSSDQQQFISANSQLITFDHHQQKQQWLRLKVSNSQPQTLTSHLLLTSGQLDQLDIFQVQGKQITAVNNQLSFLARNSSSHLQHYILNLDLKANQSSWIYFSLISSHQVDIKAEMKSYDHFIYQQQNYASWVGVIYGLILSGILYIAYLWFKNRSLIALSSSVHLFTVFLLTALWFNNWQIHDNNYFITDVLLFAFLSAYIVSQALMIYGIDWQKNSRIFLLRLTTVLVPLKILVLLLAFQNYSKSHQLEMYVSVIVIISNSIWTAVLWGLNSQHKQIKHTLLISNILIIAVLLINLAFLLHFLPQADLFHYWVLLVPFITVVSLTKINSDFLQLKYFPLKHQKFLADHNLPQVLSKLSHQLRSPINGVMGMSELISETRLSHMQRDYMDTIQLAGRDLLHLANEMSDFAKLQNKNISFEDRSFELTSCVQQCMEIFREEANRKRIELVTDIQDDIANRAFGDKERLETILINIIGHSLDHIEQGEISLRLIKNKQDQKPGIIFQLQMSGNLLDLVAIRRFFSALMPNNNNDIISLESGLSRYISKQLIELMSGTLQLEALNQQNCSISLYLPMKEDLSDSSPLESDKLQGSKVLLIDDNANFRTVIKKHLSRWGMKVESTYSGREALAMIRSGQSLNEFYDFIIVDHDMPIMNGIEFTQRLMQDNEIQPKPIRVMLTGLGLGAAELAAKDAGIQHIISKPVSGHRLKEVLIELIKQRQGQQQQKLAAPDQVE